MVPRPHFLLFCDGQSPQVSKAKEAASVGGSSVTVRGRWRFVLEDLDAGTRLEACDAELVQAPERAALLAVVRGLEALEQPSRVTLVTTSRYVSRGLQFGLIEWRESDYCWEHFGSVQPIRNADLWRRIDHAMQFHQIKCQWIAGESAREGEESTQLEIEPIFSKPVIEAMNPDVSSIFDGQGAVPSTEKAFDGSDHATGSEDVLSPSGWGRFAWLFWSSPVRSLRLPSLSSLSTSIDRHGWIGRIMAGFSWISKIAGVKRLAV